MYKEANSNLYNSLRDDLIRNSLSFCRQITTFAMLEELSDLHASFCYSAQELSKANDDKLLIISHHIINKLREFVNDMGEYGINDESLNEFFKLIKRFQSAIQEDTTISQNIDSDIMKFTIE
jgi:hypothetical protein